MLVPGEPEKAYTAARRANGIEVDDTTWQEIQDSAAKLGITPAEIATAIGANA